MAAARAEEREGGRGGGGGRNAPAGAFLCDGKEEAPLAAAMTTTSDDGRRCLEKVNARSRGPTTAFVPIDVFKPRGMALVARDRSTALIFAPDSELGS